LIKGYQLPGICARFYGTAAAKQAIRPCSPIPAGHRPARCASHSFDKIQRYRLNLNHLTLPEIKDFNALGDRFCFRQKAKRFMGHGG